MTGDDLDDLSCRMENAAKTLAGMAGAASRVSETDGARLKGKAEGVRLALSYVNDLRRNAADPRNARSQKGDTK